MAAHGSCSLCSNPLMYFNSSGHVHGVMSSAGLFGPGHTSMHFVSTTPITLKIHRYARYRLGISYPSSERQPHCTACMAVLTFPFQDWWPMALLHAGLITYHHCVSQFRVKQQHTACPMVSPLLGCSVSDLQGHWTRAQKPLGKDSTGYATSPPVHCSTTDLKIWTDKSKICSSHY